jgi:hypothetical protein
MDLAGATEFRALGPMFGLSGQLTLEEPIV